MNDHSVEAALDALGEPARRRILELLQDGPRPVGVLAEQLPIGRPAVSRHLRVLSDAGLVHHRSAGTRNLYALAPAALVPLQRWLTGLWGHALADYAAAVVRAATPSPTSTQED